MELSQRKWIFRETWGSKPVESMNDTNECMSASSSAGTVLAVTTCGGLHSGHDSAMESRTGCPAKSVALKALIVTISAARSDAPFI